MMGSRSGHVPAGRPVGPDDAQLNSLGKLFYLASYCELHRKFPARSLSNLFFPAVSNNCVRFFENEGGMTAAALIWARLSDEVSERMLYDKVPPKPDEWVSGNNLWFLDLLAPFDHGSQVARHIARNPPAGPFYFARLGKGDIVRKVVRGDASGRASGRVHAFFLDQAA